MSDVPSPGAVLEAPEDHEAAEGVDAGGDEVGSESTLREMMLATDPDEPLEAVEAPYDPERGGLTRIYRGLQKALSIDGMPAIVDIVVGMVEVVQNADLEGVPGDDQDDVEEQPEPDVEEVI